MKRLILLFFVFYSTSFFSQSVAGKVLEIVNGKELPLVGANVFLLDKSKGDISDLTGDFLIENIGNAKEYIVSYVGYMNDTLKINNEYSKIILNKNSNLDEINISFKEKTSSVSLLSSTNLLKISSFF